MSFLTSRIGRYLLVRSAVGYGIALGAVLAAILLIDVVEQMRTLGDRVDLSLLDAAQLTLMKTPMLIEQTLPFVVLAGAIIAVVGLNRSSELIALRASGVSAWRFLLPPVALAAAMGVFVATILNPIGAHFYQAYEVEKNRMLSETPEQPAGDQVWIRQPSPDGQIVIFADGWAQQGMQLNRATFMFFTASEGALRFTRRVVAEQAVLRPGFWQLSNLVEVQPGGAPSHAEYLAIPTSLEPAEMLDRFTAPATLSFWRLPAFIHQAQKAGLAPVRFELKWQGLLAYPFMLAGMAGLGAVFSVRLQRLGNVAAWIGFGAGIGLFLFFFGQLAAAFATAQSVPAIVAAWSPPLAGLFAAFAFVAYLEDG